MVVISLLGTSKYNVAYLLLEYYHFGLIKFDEGDLEKQLDSIASMIENGCHKIVVSNVSDLKQVRALRFFFSSIVFQIGSPQEINPKIKPDYIIFDRESEYQTFRDILEAMGEII